ISDLLAAIQIITDLGSAAFAQLVDLIPEPILSILQALFESGLFPGKAHAVRQDITEWLLALIDVLIQMFGAEVHDLLIQVAADLGIPAALIDILWDLVVSGGFVAPAKNAIRQDIIQWAIDQLIEFGLEAVVTIAEFLPPEIISILVDLVLGFGLGH
ncbi:unnamed protein product, partial [Notodromas monacha]